jgi:hypothetical protein
VVETYSRAPSDGRDRSIDPPITEVVDHLSTACSPAPKPPSRGRRQVAAPWIHGSPRVPAIALLLSVLIGMLPVVLKGSDDPAMIACGTEISKYVSIYDDHPDARPSLPASSQEEQKCHINEYLKQLKPKALPGAPAVVYLDLWLAECVSSYTSIVFLSRGKFVHHPRYASSATTRVRTPRTGSVVGI